MKKIVLRIFTVILLSFTLTGCEIINITPYVKIIDPASSIIEVGEEIDLDIKTFGLEGNENWVTQSTCISVDSEGVVYGLEKGMGLISVYIGEYKDTIIIEVVPSDTDKLILTTNTQVLAINDTLELVTNQTNENITYEILSGNSHATLDGNIVKGISKGEVTIVAKLDDTTSNELIINIIDNDEIESITLSAQKYSIEKGESVRLTIELYPIGISADVIITSTTNEEFTQLSKIQNIYTVKGINSGGSDKYQATFNGITSNEITITVEEAKTNLSSITITSNKTQVSINEEITLSFTTVPVNAVSSVNYNIISGSECVTLIGNVVTTLSSGTVKINATSDGITSNTIEINITNVLSDPYIGMSEDEFYDDYNIATCANDAGFRTKHYFMSGEITEQTQEPTIEENRPTKNSMFIKNSEYLFDNEKTTYNVLDKDGNVAFKVYKEGAYVTLEDVAAYIFAYGDIPANYTSSKSGSPSSSPWGEFLRLNNSDFSGDTSRYPFEPVLPNISGCGGNLEYKEIDIGTTGTDCDPNYTSEAYNNGSKITRGAARIVYAVKFQDSNYDITDLDERYVFYTYNHYNDFEEYLNYQNGWGEMFGNITGGGQISSKYDYNPTEYPQVLKQYLR